MTCLERLRTYLRENAEEIVFDAGTHRDTLKVRYADWERLAQPTVLDFALHE